MGSREMSDWADGNPSQAIKLLMNLHESSSTNLGAISFSIVANFQIIAPIAVKKK